MLARCNKKCLPDQIILKSYFIASWGITQKKSFGNPVDQTHGRTARRCVWSNPIEVVLSHPKFV